MTTDTLNTSQTVHIKLLAALEKSDLRNQKGREAIHVLIIKSHSVKLISDHVKASNGEREQYVNGLLALVEQYDCGASVVIRTLCESAATDDLKPYFLEKKLIAILLELGVLLRLGERSYQWQIAEKIGVKPTLWSYFKPLLDVESTQALRKQQALALNEARLLNLTQKQALLARQRKQTALQATHAAQEAERLAASLPPRERSSVEWMKGNAMPLVIAVLLGIVVIGSALQSDGTPANSPQLSSFEPIESVVDPIPTLAGDQ